MSFGWSVGDIALTVQFLVKIGTALREADGAKAEFQEAARSLAGLELTLQYLEQQQQAAGKQTWASTQGGATPVAQSSARDSMLSTSIDLIKEPVSNFLDDIEKYDKSLGARSKAHFTSGARTKVQWALFVTDKVKELQSRIDIPLRTLNILQHETIIQSASEQHQATIETIIELGRNLPSEINNKLSETLAFTNPVARPPTPAITCPIFLVPYTPNPNFVGRSAMLDCLKAALTAELVSKHSQPQARATLWGLGGVG